MGDTRERVCLVKLSVCMDVCLVGDYNLWRHHAHEQVYTHLFDAVKEAVRITFESVYIYYSLVKNKSILFGSRNHS